MSKHTPGPWFVTDEYGETVVEWTSDSGSTYYITQAVGSPGPDGECPKANARLIAAAPELLEACQTVFEFIKRGMTVDLDTLNGLALSRLDYAITKATKEEA